VDGVTINQRIIADPSKIVKVNLMIGAVSDHKSRKTGRYYSDMIHTSVTIQNMAFVNKYK